MKTKKHSITRKEVRIAIFWCFFIIVISSNCTYEQLHETVALDIKIDQNSHIITFMPNLDLTGDFFWDFGDSTTSTLSSQTHVYEEMGAYDVSLSIVNENRLLKASKTIVIVGLEDVEGNVYSTISLNNQLWTTENLSTTTCSDGTLIDPNNYQIKEDGSIVYNYLALEQCNICPDGWRVPTAEDIDNLRFVEKTVEEVEDLLNVSEEGFGGGYLRIQGHRIHYDDFRYAIENTFSWRTVEGDENTFSVVRCIKVF